MKDKLFLLSVEEAKELPEEILYCNGIMGWWLRSPGKDKHTAMIVSSQYYNGGVFFVGNFVAKDGFFDLAARPAFMIKESDIETKNNVTIFGNKKWNVIKRKNGIATLFLCEESMTRELLTRFDAISNDYKTSDIRYFLMDLATSWFTKAELDLIIDWEDKVC
jgi:hypothetical protein